MENSHKPTAFDKDYMNACKAKADSYTKTFNELADINNEQEWYELQDAIAYYHGEYLLHKKLQEKQSQLTLFD